MESQPDQTPLEEKQRRRKVYGDFEKVLDNIRYLRKSKSIRRAGAIPQTSGLKYNGPASLTEMDMSILQTRYLDQAWPGVSDTNYSKYGRGLISLQYFKKNDIILDYHGETVRNIPFNTYIDNDEVNPEYCIETFHSNKRIIDATSEGCVIHRERKCYGRLANHAHNKNAYDCNMKLVDVKLTLKGLDVNSHVLLVAKRNIQPFEELRFDYGDPVAHRLFDKQPILADADLNGLSTQ
jgi:hypothetical protein